MPLWISHSPLVLASTSQTRLSLVEAAGIAAVARKPEVDERAIEKPLRDKGLSVRNISLNLARAKALDVSARVADQYVLGADQTLECEGVQYHKPADIDKARAQIAALSGRTHYLHSSAVVAYNGEVVFETTVSAALTMRPISENFIDQYVKAMGDKVCGSVGGYQLEGIGIQLFSHIEGDYFTILGLPLLPLMAYFREIKLLAQ